MTTPTPIATFEDILAAMENNPSLQAAMRQHVLDQEFLQLPAIVRELQQAVQELQQAVQELQQTVQELQQTVAQLTQLVHDYIAATNARLDRLENDVAELKTGQAQLAAGQARLEGNMNRLIGSDYERKAARRASRLAKRYLGLEDMQVIYAITTPDNNQLPEILDNAIRAGSLSASEADELEEVDIVMRSPTEYAVVEVSVTLDESDVQRARERAGMLSKAITEPVRAAVIGAHALDSASQLAAADHVAIMTLAE